MTNEIPGVVGAGVVAGVGVGTNKKIKIVLLQARDAYLQT